MCLRIVLYVEPVLAADPIVRSTEETILQQYTQMPTWAGRCYPIGSANSARLVVYVLPIPHEIERANSQALTMDAQSNI